MGWDESAFGWLFNKVKLYQSAKDQRPRLFEQEGVLAAFERLASFVAGHGIDVVLVKDNGGKCGQQLFLNEVHPFVTDAQQAYQLYLFKIFTLIYRSRIKLLRLNRESFFDLLDLIQIDWPLFFELKEEVFKTWDAEGLKIEFTGDSTFEKWLGVVSNPTLFPMVNGDASAKHQNNNGEDEDRISSEMTLQRATEIKKVDLKKQENENPFVHSFEKVHTLDQYSGGLKTQDGADEIAEHSNALQELQMDTMSISTESANSLIKVEVLGGSLESRAEPSEEQRGSSVQSYLYPEWDSKLKRYRKDWCCLFETDAKVDENHHSGSINELDKRNLQLLNNYIGAIHNERRWRNAQADGEDIDIDATQDFMISLRAHQSPNERVYRRKPTISPDWCVLVLLDQSLSTESWIGDKQVLEIEKNIAELLGRALDGANVQWGLASFYSETRKAVHFHWHKRFSKNKARTSSCWNSLQRLRPEGATRLGPVLRHGVRVLSKMKNQKKLVLFISDTKPTDFDYYEGQYGANDFAKAIQEARQSSIYFHVCAIQDKDRKKANHFFHSSEFSIVSKSDDLISSLKLWFPFIF